MDNIDDSENNAKVSDSAYSNSCSNSRSRRSSKSTHSGSHSSGSSGYGGKQSTSGSSNTPSGPPEKRSKEKDVKKKKPSQTDPCTAEVKVEVESGLTEPVPRFNATPEEQENAMQTQSPVISEKGVDDMDIATPEENIPSHEVNIFSSPIVNTTNIVSTRPSPYYSPKETDLPFEYGFHCLISMQDGIVVYTSSLANTLGFPKDMWIGRSFIDFVHPKDRNVFTSRITSGLAMPKNENVVRYSSTMFCRIRRYKGLTTSGFGVKEQIINHMPFQLKMHFKNINDVNKIREVYLVMHATPLTQVAFEVPKQVLLKPTAFLIRHIANGNIEFIDPESTPYLGYLPQDLQDKDVLQFYHPADLPYLREVYETIVKDGGMPRCKAYRMLIQNGCYIKLETEWSSFVNPWSKKLEFVIGKHYVVEGPSNIDVFQNPVAESGLKLSEEEKNKAQAIREAIVRIMNEELSKPAEAAKQQMSKRCQDLANFMENHMEAQPKLDEELRLDIQEPDCSYYERDSVMLGGISPHHDYTDSMSSAETPISYKQLNYNENLQRYFDSHQPWIYEEYNTVTENASMTSKDQNTGSGEMSPMTQTFGDSTELTSSCESSGPAAKRPDLKPLRLTETLITKHNSSMEKELLKRHREIRWTKADRDKTTNKNRQNKKQHLNRCIAPFQSVDASGINSMAPQPPHGMKRASNRMETEVSKQKHHCTTPRQTRRKTPAPSTMTQSNNVFSNSAEPPLWASPSNPVSNMNTVVLGMGIPQPLSLVTPVTVPVQYMVCGQTVFGSPLMYSAIEPSLQQSIMAQALQFSTPGPLGLATSNNEEAYMATIPLKSSKSVPNLWKEKFRAEAQASSSNAEQSTSGTETTVGSSNKNREEDKITVNPAATQQTTEKSTHESCIPPTNSQKPAESITSAEARNIQPKKIIKRKVEPPWMEKVCVTSELIYKYQIRTKSLDDVLTADKQKMQALEQPSLVNEQLDQLYLDLQLEGFPSRLTLEEGITSSGSSGEENKNNTKKESIHRKKREFSKLVMIYEEDAPLPPPPMDSDETPEPSNK